MMLGLGVRVGLMVWLGLRVGVRVGLQLGVWVEVGVAGQATAAKTAMARISGTSAVALKPRLSTPSLTCVSRVKTRAVEPPTLA